MRKTFGRQAARICPVCRVLMWMLLGMICLIIPVLSIAEEGLTVHFMDIGRNDGILIECDGETAFIDSGTYTEGLKAVDYIRAQGLDHLTYYIGSHAHRDHVGGGAPIIAAFHPDALIQPHEGVQKQILANCQTEEERQAVEQLKVITPGVGDVIRIGSAEMKVLGPLRLNAGTESSDMENDNSLVCLLTYGDHSFLFTGDCPTDVMETIEAANPGCMVCTVLKNPHHNSYLEFPVLVACRPEYVVFSTGDEALPMRTTLEEVAGIGARAFITSPQQNSTVIFRTDGKTMKHTVSNGPSSVEFDARELSLYVGQEKACRANLSPSRYRAVTYSSEDPSVAGVTGTGRVIGISPGTTTIYAMTANDLVAACQVTVLPVQIRMNRETLTLKVGDSETLSVKITPSSRQDQPVLWTSDAPDIVTVNTKGRINAMSAGTTEIRAVLQDGTEAICTVTVK